MTLVLLIVATWLALDLVIVGAVCALSLRGAGRRRPQRTSSVAVRLVPIGETSVPASER